MTGIFLYSGPDNNSPLSSLYFLIIFAMKERIEKYAYKHYFSLYNMCLFKRQKGVNSSDTDENCLGQNHCNTMIAYYDKHL